MYLKECLRESSSRVLPPPEIKYCHQIYCNKIVTDYQRLHLHKHIVNHISKNIDKKGE